MAPAALGGAGLGVWDAPGQAVPGALAAMPLLPRQLLGPAAGPGSPSTRCREGDAVQRGGSSNVTASVHKLQLPGPVLSLFPPSLSSFPHRWQQRRKRFCLSDHFSLKRPITLPGWPAPGPAMQVPRVALPPLAEGDSSRHHLC